MVNVFSIYKPILHGVMKLAGMSPRRVEIQPGTVLNIWAPTTTTTRTNKPTVVFLHGFAMDGIMTWQLQVLALVKNYDVYVPDFVFFGESITDRVERTVEFQSECMARGLRQLGVERCTLVGFSYGGIVGFKMAEMYADLVRSIVVTGSVIALTEPVSNAALERIGFPTWCDYLLPKTTKAPKDLKIMYKTASYKQPNVPNFVYKDLMEAMYNNRKERHELLEALVINDKAFTIPRYPQRIHILWGENDKIFDMETAKNLKEQVAEKATLEAIEKAGHTVNFERPYVYNRHLKKILVSLVEENVQHN
ncbi:hypothetical protein JRO89_XS02G0044100 [Xanthoceras sorbifolium]|uniref:AB hydrolase-1 domain-containing protein n=1 Tax=Xanthoceras sorbifolium TaxID=99658 RepID=A0ABQ8IEH7_9ROSI|nr:hypothetical protein JRO89_XS02G0044100 [Xanthoceras sorbifolium]